jgi:Undecaprenyl-phosphate glucose phosphotransferase
VLVATLDTLLLGIGGLIAQSAAIGPGRLADEHLGLLGTTVVLTAALGGMRGAYRHPTLFSTGRQLRAILPAAAFALGFAIFAAAMFGRLDGFDPRWLIGAAAFGGGLLGVGRAAVATALRGQRGSRAALRTVIVGAGPQATHLVEFLRQRDERSMRVLGLADDGFARPGTWLAGVPVLGPVEEVFAMIRRGEVDQVVVAMPWTADERTSALLRRLTDHPVHVRLAPELIAYRMPQCGGSELGGVTLVHLQDRPISGWSAAVKWVEDQALALAALAVAAVPMALIAIAVKLDSPGPVLFRQRRTGFNNRDFFVLKFRTMYDDAADHQVDRQVRAGDPRVTRVGAILRRTSLDELPQLFNVLRGEMSFIGPRPHAPGTRAGARRFEEVVARYAARHRVKPGLTGLAQVRGWRGPTETEEKLIRRVESDLEYIECWSVWLDIAIILRTLVAVARMRNAC